MTLSDAFSIIARIGDEETRVFTIFYSYLLKQRKLDEEPETVNKQQTIRCYGTISDFFKKLEELASDKDDFKVLDVKENGKNCFSIRKSSYGMTISQLKQHVMRMKKGEL